MRSQIKQPTGGATNSEQVEALNHEEIERLAELGRLSSSILHEISNPITSALLYLDQYKDQPAAAVRKVRGSMRTLWRYVEAVRQQVRGESQASQFSVNQQITQLKRVVIPLSRQSDVKLNFDMANKSSLYGDPVKFQQIVGNLIINAIEAYGDLPSNLKKCVYICLKPEEDNLIITVNDWGQGIRPSQLSQIFEPFYTTKAQTGHGMGIGLAIVRQYVTTDFNGTISVTSSSRLGTKFVISLPLV